MFEGSLIKRKLSSGGRWGSRERGESKSSEPRGVCELVFEREAPGRMVKTTQLGFLEKLKFYYANITVEPMIAWYIIGSVVASLATQNLNLEKACRVNLNYGNEVCTALGKRETANYTREEAEVQQLVASMTIWKTLVQSSVPAVLILFFGAWSDRIGKRKPCMLLPIVGEFLTTVGFIVCTYFFYELPMEVAGITEAIFPAFTGGWMTMFMAVFSYIGDITSVETRTLRIGIVNLFSTMSLPVGTAVSGILYNMIGFYGVFSLSASIYVLAFSYGYFRINESPKEPIPSKKVPTTNVKSGCFASVKDFFNLQHLKETMSVAFKEGENNRKKRVILLMIVVMVVIGPMHGKCKTQHFFNKTTHFR